MIPKNVRSYGNNLIPPKIPALIPLQTEIYDESEISNTNEDRTISLAEVIASMRIPSSIVMAATAFATTEHIIMVEKLEALCASVSGSGIVPGCISTI